MTLNPSATTPWPPVSPEEMIELVSQSKQGKAPGPDLVLSEILKVDPEWWAPILSSLFTVVDQTGIIPAEWTNATIVPMYKKGNHPDPSHFRPISLLAVGAKLDAKHLLNKLLSWMEDLGLPGWDQTGFGKGSSPIDHCAVLAHLIDKYTRLKKSKLICCFSGS